MTSPGSESKAELIDATGAHHRAAGSDARIVSLVPSLTELLFDLGLGDRVVGRTAFCVHPKDRIRQVRSVGGTKTIDMDKLRRLSPTHVIVNIDETPRPLAERLAAEGFRVVVTHPIDVADNLPLYRLIGGLFGADAAAEALAGRFREAYAATVTAARGALIQRVLYLIWKDPWMTVSRETYISRMLALAGWETVPAEAIQRYPPIALEEPLLKGVDRVLFASEPFPFRERHIQAFREDHPQHAAKARAIDGELVSWYGSRAVRGLEYLAALLRPLG